MNAQGYMVGNAVTAYVSSACALDYTCFAD